MDVNRDYGIFEQEWIKGLRVAGSVGCGAKEFPHAFLRKA